MQTVFVVFPPFLLLLLVALEAEVTCCLGLLALLGASLAISAETITKTYVVERRYARETALTIWMRNSRRPSHWATGNSISFGVPASVFLGILIGWERGQQLSQRPGDLEVLIYPHPTTITFFLRGDSGGGFSSIWWSAAAVLALFETESAGISAGRNLAVTLL